MGNVVIHDATFIDIIDLNDGLSVIKLKPKLDKIVCIKKSNPNYKKIYEMLKKNHMYTFELILKSNNIYFIENVKMLQIYEVCCKINKFVDVTKKYNFNGNMYVLDLDCKKNNKKIIINENQKKYISMNQNFKIIYSKHPIEDLYEVINFVAVIDK